MAHVDHHPPADVDLPLGGALVQLAEDLVLSAVSARAFVFPAHEVSVQLRLRDQEVQLPLLPLSLMAHRTRRKSRGRSLNNKPSLFTDVTSLHTNKKVKEIQVGC